MSWQSPEGRGRLRIALVSTPFVPVPPPSYGGTELVVAELARGLTHRGHEVVLFATGDSRSPGSLRYRFSEAMWPPDPLIELEHAAWVVEDIRRDPRSFDLVHAHVPALLGLVRFLRDLPIVYTIHHDRDDRLSRYYEGVDPSVIPVAISRRQAMFLPEFRQVDVVHHGLDVDAYRLGRRGQGYLAFLGRFSRVKGPDLAIDVAWRLGRELRMGGRFHREEDDEFEEKVLAPLLHLPHVRLLGELCHAPKIDLLSGADALLFPIRWEEPFGLVMIEAMLCGCPVVAFPGGAVEEVVEHGVTGFLATNEDDMVRLVRDEVPRLDRGRVRARAVERFSSLRMVDDYLSIYRRAVAPHRQGAMPAQEVELR